MKTHFTYVQWTVYRALQVCNKILLSTNTNRDIIKRARYTLVWVGSHHSIPAWHKPGNLCSFCPYGRPRRLTRRSIGGPLFCARSYVQQKAEQIYLARILRSPTFATRVHPGGLRDQGSRIRDQGSGIKGQGPRIRYQGTMTKKWKRERKGLTTANSRGG